MKTYGVRTLTVTSPIQTPTEPVSLLDAKVYCHINHFHEDDNISTLITAAREYAESIHGRDLVTAQWDLTIDAWTPEIDLADGVSSVDLVQYTDDAGADHALAEGTDYIVDLRRAFMRPVVDGDWPSASLWPTSAILIRYTVTPTVPASVKTAIMRLVAHCHTNRLPFEIQAGVPNEWPVDIHRLLWIGAKAVIV